MLGDKAAHSSHALCVHKGLCFCTLCGGYGSWKPKKLTDLWTEVMTGAAAISRIRRGLLPSGVKQWPAERLAGLLAGEDLAV